MTQITTEDDEGYIHHFCYVRSWWRRESPRTLTAARTGGIYEDVRLEFCSHKGEIEKWQGELTSPNHLMRAGWTKGTLKPGDQVTFSGLRAKGGTTTLWITKIIAADGHEITLSPAD